MCIRNLALVCSNSALYLDAVWWKFSNWRAKSCDFWHAPQHGFLPFTLNFNDTWNVWGSFSLNQKLNELIEHCAVCITSNTLNKDIQHKAQTMILCIRPQQTEKQHPWLLITYKCAQSAQQIWWSLFFQLGVDDRSYRFVHNKCWKTWFIFAPEP